MSPLFSVRRFQRPYAPMRRPPISERAFTAFERAIKSALFGCRMCGNCILQETAFICPMACPKGLRNGPCGGSTPERCYVDTSRPCVWYRIFERSERMGRMDILLEVQAPLDGANAGKETWIEMYRQWRESGFSIRKRDEVFYKVRQPEWWQGDAEPHPANYEGVASTLEARLKSGGFAITAECAPPLVASGESIHKKLSTWSEGIDSVNFTDNPSAVPRMSSMACCVIGTEAGMDTVLQMAARDRTRTAIQSEALGAAALGVSNILCLTGDHASLGPNPMSKLEPVDVDAIQMLWILRRMRDDGTFLDGRAIKQPPKLFLGAAASPFASTPRYQALREEKKINAGAQFFQTQCIFDEDTLEKWLEALDKRNLLDRVYILAGITPLRSARAARFMDEEIPGVFIPKPIIERMENASDPKEEGVQIALELIDRVKDLPGVNGLHIMAIGWESIVMRLVEESGIERPPLPAIESEAVTAA